MKNSNRCPWVGQNKPHYEHYHDTEWGVPVHNDNLHFEMLVLEGAQAGLSWETILKRREAYRKAFKEFDPRLCAQLSDAYLEELYLRPATYLQDPGIIRNRLKIFSVRQNAKVFLSIQDAYGSFDHYVWNFVDHKPKINRPESLHTIPTQTTESKALSKDLKKRGMSFVGPTILYAYMQAIGMVDDHIVGCFKCLRS